MYLCFEQKRKTMKVGIKVAKKVKGQIIYGITTMQTNNKTKDGSEQIWVKWENSKLNQATLNRVDKLTEILFA
jgi:hypothetical protein